VKTPLRWLLAIPAFSWAFFGLKHAFGGYAVEDQMRGMSLAAWVLVLISGYVVACIFRKTRPVAAVSLLILVVTVAAAMGLRSHRLATGVQQLEAIYRDIAACGQPFPDAIDRDSYENPTFLQWYYQKHSEQSFAIVYIVSSNGWAMEYPGGAWRFVGNKPDGYVPEEKAGSDD
jgi:hypothetical protein